MAQVSIGQVENLEDLVRGLLSVREALESACLEQIAAAQDKFGEACEEAQNSESMLESAIEQEHGAQQAVEECQENLENCQSELSAAESALSAW